MAFAWLAHDISDDARRQLDVLAAAGGGLQAAAFGPAGGWVLVGRAGRAEAPPFGRAPFAARGIPDAAFVQLRGFVADGHSIRWIGLPAAGADRWVIVTNRGYRAEGIPEDCFGALVQGWHHGLRPSCIAFPPPAAADDGDFSGGWVLLAGRTVLGRGVDAACWQRLNNLAQGLRPARQVAFAPGGGWAVVGDDGVTTHGLPDACRAHIGQVEQTHVVEQLVFATNGGWLVASATPKTPLPVDPLRGFEQRFRLVAGRWCGVDERIAAHGVSGASVTVAVGGRLVWATRYGADAANKRLFDAEQRLAVRDALLDETAADVDHDVADTRCVLRRWPAERAACAVLLDGGDAAGRAALAEEAVEALVRTHGWDRRAPRLAG